MDLYCGFCLTIRASAPDKAITIMNGQACCRDHMYYVQGGEFNRILAYIKLDEKKKEVKWEKVDQSVKDDAAVLRKTDKRLSNLTQPETTTLSKAMRRLLDDR